MKLLRLLALIVVSASANAASAAFTLVAGSGQVTVQPTVGATISNSSSASGLYNALTPTVSAGVSLTNFYSWHMQGSLGTNLGNTLNAFSTSMGSSIAGVYLVSNGVNPSLPGVPATIAGANFQRQAAGAGGTSAGFSQFEPLMLANAANSGIIIDFATPVQGAGMRISSDTGASPDDFFIRAFTSAGAEVAYAGSNTGLTLSFSPTPDNTANFYGLQGADSSETFSRLFIGFAGTSIDPGAPFAISTLEVLGGGGSPPVNPNAVPVPPTLYAGFVGVMAMAGWIRRRRS